MELHHCTLPTTAPVVTLIYLRILSLFLSPNFSGTRTHVKLEIGLGLSPGALVIETGKSAGMLWATSAAAAVTDSRFAFSLISGMRELWREFLSCRLFFFGVV
jgi:hypothetical protein